MSGGLLGAVERLRAATTRQVDAARRLAGPELEACNQARADALFELRLALEEGPPTVTPALRDEVRRLRMEERRLEAVARAVLTVVEKIDPTWPAVTYGRSGDLR